MAIWRKCLEHSVAFFSSILGIETFFLVGFKVFCIVLIKGKSSHVKKIEKHDGKNVFL